MEGTSTTWDRGAATEPRLCLGQHSRRRSSCEFTWFASCVPPVCAARSVFERFRAVLHQGDIDKRVQFVIEGLFALRKAGFDKSGHVAVPTDLDLVEAGACAWLL